jgi:heavy metal sensor kinase
MTWRERPWRDIRWRLTLWYAAAMGATLTLFAAGSLAVLHHVLSNRADQFLMEARAIYLAELAVELAELRDLRAAVLATEREVRFRDVHVCAFEGAGRALSCGSGMSLPPPAPVLGAVGVLARATRAAAAGTVRFMTVSDDSGGHRLVGGPVDIGGLRVTVVAASARHSLRETVEQVALAYSVTIPLVLIVAGVGGIALARRALAPTAEMARNARAITAANLDARLEIGHADDELGRLAAVINELLGRLEAAFVLQRRFVADASHELRTPVATIAAEVDIALGQASRSEGEYRDALEVVGGAGRRLSRLVNDLFLLARVDSGQLPLRHEALYLDEIAIEVGRALRAMAASRAVQITIVAEEAPWAGDPVLLERLLSNLVENAVAHAPDGSRVQVRVDAAEHGGWRLSVHDAGPGIAPGMRERVFERFYRVDASRTRAGDASGGAGLGLAIARAIAEAHGGTLRCAEPPPTSLSGRAVGACFVLELPAAESS